MKNFKYASPQDFLSIPQAKTPYDDRHSSQKNQDIIVLLVFQVKKLFRMRSSKRNDIDLQEGKNSSGATLSLGEPLHTASGQAGRPFYLDFNNPRRNRGLAYCHASGLCGDYRPPYNACSSDAINTLSRF
jgi:hypothetical protein